MRDISVYTDHSLRLELDCKNLIFPNGMMSKTVSRRLLLLFILCISSILVFAGCTYQEPDILPKAEAGVIDLTQFKFENKAVKLDGEWGLYWNKLIDPVELDSSLEPGYIAIPSSWNMYTENEAQSGYGYATYRLQLLMVEQSRLALKLPRLFTAYNLWVNGELIASSGDVGKTREAMTPQYLPQVAIFESQPGLNEILIQVSNYHHRSGGVLESIILGSEKQILDLRYRALTNEAILFGSLLCLGGYHLALFLFRKKNTSSLYFGLFCLLVGIRTMLVGERFFIHLFPAFSWEVAHKIQTLTYYFGVPIMLMFFISVYPRYFHTKVIRISQIIGAAFGLLVLLTPARVFTSFNLAYQAWTMLAILYILVILVRLGIHKEAGSLFVIIGALALLLSSANDVIFHNIWLNDNGSALLRAIVRTGNLSSTGQLIFAFSISLLLAKNFSDSLTQEEILSVQLQDINANLDKIVLDRTEALVESNEKIEQQRHELEKANQQLQELSLKDPLSTLWNRRKYDETIRLEWNRCLRYQRPIALLLIDIDFFKEYNDRHGHLAGDECLKTIGQTFMQSLSRSSDLVARYGGEEFIAVLPETGIDEVILIAERLRQRIETLHISHGHSPVSEYVTVSLGVTSTIPTRNTTSDNLFQVVDKALYQAKANGRNQVVFLSE